MVSAKSPVKVGCIKGESHYCKIDQMTCLRGDSYHFPSRYARTLLRTALSWTLKKHSALFNLEKKKKNYTLCGCRFHLNRMSLSLMQKGKVKWLFKISRKIGASLSSLSFIWVSPIISTSYGTTAKWVLYSLTTQTKIIPFGQDRAILWRYQIIFREKHFPET